MRRTTIIAALVFLVASVATAQPLSRSAQCHWAAPGVNGAIDPIADPAHLHVDMGTPPDKRISGPIRLPFAIIAHHARGHVSGFWAGVYHLADPSGNATDVIWDTPDGSQPYMEGDPAGDRTWTGSAVFTPNVAHGWLDFYVSASLNFDNGDVIETDNVQPFYSMVDPSQPEVEWGYPYAATSCVPTSTRSDAWGQQLVELINGEVLPVAPYSSYPSLTAKTNGYGATDVLPPSEVQERLDLDLHHGIPGTIIAAQRGGPPNWDVGHNHLTFSLNGFPAGTHKVAIMRFQSSPDFTEQATSLMVFNVTADPSAPAVTGPFIGPTGPVAPPPPVPVVTWTTIQPFFQRFGSEDRYRLCVTPDHCVELVIK